MMQGMTPSSLKKHPALIPLFVCLGMGMAGSVLYTLRLALKNPDVSWNNKKQPEPWNEYSDKQYKFFNPSGLDVPKVQIPKY